MDRIEQLWEYDVTGHVMSGWWVLALLAVVGLMVLAYQLGRETASFDSFHSERDQDMTRYISDETAMQRIFEVLDGEEWESDTIEAVAEIVTHTGRVIREPDDYDPIYPDGHPDSPTVGGPGFDDNGYGS